MGWGASLLDKFKIFIDDVDPVFLLVAFAVALWVLGYVVTTAFKLIGRLFHLWQAAREVVLNGDELDDATREHLIAAFDLLPDEDILGYRRRRFVFAPDESLIVTQKRISLDQALGPTTLLIPETFENKIIYVPDGRFVVGPFEIAWYGRKEGNAYGRVAVNVMGGRNLTKLVKIITDAIARHRNDAADERVPRRGVIHQSRKSRPFISERLIYKIIPAVPMIVGLGLFAMTWGEVSQSLERLAASEAVPGNVIGYERIYDDDEQEHAYYPTVRFIDRDGDTRTFTSSIGGMKIYQVGEEVEVLHDREDPLKAVINSFWELYLAALIMGFMGAAFFGVGIALAKLVRSGG